MKPLFRCVFLVMLLLSLSSLPSLFSLSAIAAELPKQGRTDQLKEADQASVHGEPEALIFSNTIGYEKGIRNADFVTGDERCDAELSLEYAQYDDVVKIDTLLINKRCGASEGAYTLLVETVSDDGESKTIKHIEKWRRFDQTDFIGSHEYPLESGAYVKRVRSRLSSFNACVCAEVPASTNPQ